VRRYRLAQHVMLAPNRHNVAARLGAPPSIVTVTKRRCAWCGQGFTAHGGPGRPRRYCKRSCRQRDYEARRRAAELGLSEGELVVTREELELTRDRLYLLERAIEDVEHDLAEHADNPEDRERAFSWLLDAARQAIARPPG
jgi:hypothetical protein